MSRSAFGSANEFVTTFETACRNARFNGRKIDRIKKHFLRAKSLRCCFSSLPTIRERTRLRTRNYPATRSPGHSWAWRYTLIYQCNIRVQSLISLAPVPVHSRAHKKQLNEKKKDNQNGHKNSTRNGSHVTQRCEWVLQQCALESMTLCSCNLNQSINSSRQMLANFTQLYFFNQIYNIYR